MNKKQTAVEWLHSALDELEMTKNKRSLVLHLDLRAELFQQAKAMEKEQIIDAVHLPKEKRWYDAKLYNSSGEQYYNETYGQ